MKPQRKLTYIPEILYDTPAYPGQKVSPIPFMIIPKDKDMPIGLFILEYRETGEFEVGPQGLPESIEEGPFPHTYLEMDYLFEVLNEQFPELDMTQAKSKIRVALGMKATAAESKQAGEQILKNVTAKSNELEQKLLSEQEARKQKLSTLIQEAAKKDGKQQ